MLPDREKIVWRVKMATHILVIDVDNDYVESVVNLLEAKGYDVDSASNGTDGVAKAKANKKKNDEKRNAKKRESRQREREQRQVSYYLHFYLDFIFYTNSLDAFLLSNP